MGYCMRYIVTDDQPLSLDDVEGALKSVDPAYAITDGELYNGADLSGEIEINVRGDEICDEKLVELEEFAEDAEGESSQQVMVSLRNAKAVLAVRVLWQGRDAEPTLEKLDPAWDWLLSDRQGLMQADGEGYYDASGLILEVE